MSFKITGKIQGIQDIQTFDSGAKKITFQVKTEEQYNNLYSFELFKTGEHVKFVENFTKYNKVDDTVTVEFNINTNEYKGKYYTSLPAWKVEGNMGTVDKPNEEHETFVAEGDSDLPF